MERSTAAKKQGSKSLNSELTTSTELRRWLVVGIFLHNVLIPPIRGLIRKVLPSYYKKMKRMKDIHTQTFKEHMERLEDNEVLLNYRSINGNEYISSPEDYDYNVKNPISFAKLFMEPYMVKFKEFDDAFEASATLAVYAGVTAFDERARFQAKKVNDRVRKPWAHPNFSAWTKDKYEESFNAMKSLVERIFRGRDKDNILDKLELWKTQGLDICLGKPLDDVIVRSLLEEVEALKEKLTTYKEKTGDLEGEEILQGLNLFKDEVSKDLKKLQADQAKIENSFQEIKMRIRDDLRAELRGLFEEENSRFREEITNEMKEIKQTVAENSRRLEKLEDIVRTLTDDFQSSFERLGNMRHYILRDDKDSQSNKQLAAATAHTAELHEKSPDVQEQSQDLEKLDDVNQWRGEMKGKEKENSRRLEVLEKMVGTLGNGVPDVQTSLDGSGNIRQQALKDGKNSQSNKQLAAATAHTAELHEKSPDVHEQSQDLEKLDDVNQWKGEMKDEKAENSKRLEESRDKDKEFPATACAGELHARCQDLQRPRNNKKRQKRGAKKGSKK